MVPTGWRQATSARCTHQKAGLQQIWLDHLAPRCRIVFDDWITYKMDLIKEVMQQFKFEVKETGKLKLLMEKNGD